MNNCKVLIGSKYIGPCLDRPCLRQMPRNWVLEESRPVRRQWWMTPDRWVGVVCVLAYVVLLAQAIAQVAK